MQQFFFVLAIFGLPIWGLSQQTINGSLLHDGIERDYILYIPASYNGASSVPLVFNFHGYSSNAGEQMGYGDFRPIADTAGFILLHPQGTLLDGVTHWNVGGWTLGSTADDVGFTEALIEAIAAEYNIDLNRVYATGMSNGGFMSFLLACQLSEKIAAVASVTGSMTPETFNNCNPQHPMPVLQIHGTADLVVPYNGNSWSRPVSEVLEYWVDHNNCQDSPTVNALPNINIWDGSTVEHIVHHNGDNGATTEHFKVTGGGHTWPGTAFVSFGTNYDIDASLEIWRFFSRYDINGLISLTGVESVTAEDPNPNIFPNPTNAHLRVEWQGGQEMDYQLSNLTGQIVLSGTIRSANQDIDLSALPKGVYFLKLGTGSQKILKME